MILLLLSPGNIRFDDRNITEPQIIARIGLWMTLVFTCILAVFISQNAIGSEVDRGSVHLLLVRPVSRARFWLERWMGVTVLASVNAVLMLGALMISLGLRFGMDAIKLIIPGLLLFPLPVACLTGMVTAINTRLPAALAGFAGIGVALVGFFRGQFEIIAEAGSGVRAWLMQALVWISPPLNQTVGQITQFNNGDSLDFWLLHECMLYLYVTLALGLLLFNRREV